MITCELILQFTVTGEDAEWLLAYCQENNKQPQELFNEFLQEFKQQSSKTNAERLGMSLEQLAKVDDIEFDV